MAKHYSLDLKKWKNTNQNNSFDLSVMCKTRKDLLSKVKYLTLCAKIQIIQSVSFYNMRHFFVFLKKMDLVVCFAVFDGGEACVFFKSTIKTGSGAKSAFHTYGFDGNLFIAIAG